MADAQLRQPGRQAQPGDQRLDLVGGGRVRIAQRGGDLGHLRRADLGVVAHHRGQQHAGGDAVRHAGVGAQRMAQAVAGAVLGAADAGGRQPGAQLAVEPGVQVVGVARVAGQRAAQQLQRAHAGGVDQRLGVDRAQRLHRMVDRAHAGGQPQPGRRVQGDARVEDDGGRADEGAGVALFGAEAGVGAAAQVAELGARQGGRHRNLAAGRPAWLRRHAAAIGRHAQVPVVQLLDAGEALGQRHQRHLHGVDHRAAADADHQVGLRRTQRLRQRNHAVARRVLDAVVEQPHHLRRYLRQRGGHRIGVAVQ